MDGLNLGLSGTPFFGGVFGRVFPDGVMTVSRMLLISLIGFIVVFAVLGVIALFVKLLGTVFDTMAAKKKKTRTPAQSPTVTGTNEKAPAAAEPVKAEVKLTDVTDEQAAMIMAIVSHRSGIPLNRLKFNYIKPAEDNTK